MTHPTLPTEVLEKRKEVIGWMNYGIERGKTIPVFEDLVDALIEQAVIAREREIKEKINSFRMTEIIGTRTGRGAKSVTAVINNKTIDRIIKNI